MTKRKVYDISLTIYPGMLVWPGQPQVAIDNVKSIARGDPNNASLIHIYSHATTHVDAPRHFIPGARSIDAIAPEVLLGPARLFQLPDAHHIDRNLLERLDLKGVERLLFGTRNSALLRKNSFEQDFVSLTEDAARYLVDKGIRLVGIDYLSVEEYQKKGLPTHHILLEAGVVIVEALDLTAVPPGDYELFCLPLKIKDGDGAPARVFLREI
jgi:arylformamidase